MTSWVNQKKKLVKCDEVENPRVGVMRFLSSLQKKVGETSRHAKRGLIYVDIWVNQKHAKSTMIDSGTTHNFMTVAEVRRLNLHWKMDTRKMKVINSTALPSSDQWNERWYSWKDGVVCRLRGCRGMDDFDVVLRMKFLLEHQVILMPSAKCLVITRSIPTG